MKGRVFFFVAAVCLIIAAPAFAWHSSGCVYCDANGNGIFDTGDIPLAGVTVKIRNEAGTYSATAVTDSSGCFYIRLPDIVDTYIQTLDTSTLPEGATIIDPDGGVLKYTLGNGNPDSITYTWLVDCEPHTHQACWMTGGGVKFCKELDMRAGECGPRDSWGGNVYPSCDPDPGHGGSWNHLSHSKKLHFHGTDIEVVRCGNVPGIDPGSESPVTPFNFIEFKGFGWLRGIHGNNVSYDKVYFFARVEDRNEPGSNGANDGEDKDRYFLHVFSDPSDPVGTTLLLVDQDGDASTVDPLIITGGNLQLHISSCDDPPAWAN